MQPAKELEIKFLNKKDTHAGVQVTLNQSKSDAFSLDEHRKRMDLIWEDFENYRVVIRDLNRRLDIIEDTLKESKSD